MSHYRKVYDNVPEIITVPPELRHRRVEVIMLPLDEPVLNGEQPAVERTVDENGWPIGFFEETAGGWTGEPLERAPQGEYEIREELE